MRNCPLLQATHINIQVFGFRPGLNRQIFQSCSALLLPASLEKKRIGAQELADRFEVSPRTIYRDIDTINMAGIPVRSTSGVGGGFEIMPEYKMDKRVFSTAELSALLMGLTLSLIHI